MKHRHSIWAVALVALLTISAAIAVAACGGDDGGGGGRRRLRDQDRHPVPDHAATSPSSASSASSGVKLAVDEINAAGGIKSMGGAKIELVEADSQGKPDVGISEVAATLASRTTWLGHRRHLPVQRGHPGHPGSRAAADVPIVITMAVADDDHRQGVRSTPSASARRPTGTPRTRSTSVKDAARLWSVSTSRRSPCCTRTPTSVTSTATGQKKYAAGSGHGDGHRSRLPGRLRRPHHPGVARSRLPTRTSSSPSRT